MISRQCKHPHSNYCWRSDEGISQHISPPGPSLALPVHLHPAPSSHLRLSCLGGGIMSIYIRTDWSLVTMSPCWLITALKCLVKKSLYKSIALSLISITVYVYCKLMRVLELIVWSRVTGVCITATKGCRADLAVSHTNMGSTRDIVSL